MVEVMLNHLLVIKFDVGAQAQHEDQLGALFRTALELRSRGLPEFLARGMQALDVRIDARTARKRRSIRGSVVDQTANGNSEALQRSHHSLFHRHSEYIEAGQWNISESFFRFSLACRISTDEYYGPYVHDCHLGAAARKIAEREGIQDGILRNLEI